MLIICSGVVIINVESFLVTVSSLLWELFAMDIHLLHEHKVALNPLDVVRLWPPFKLNSDVVGFD